MIPKSQLRNAMALMLTAFTTNALAQQPVPPFLQEGDEVRLCGDSIIEQGWGYLAFLMGWPDTCSTHLRMIKSGITGQDTSGLEAGLTTYLLPDLQQSLTATVPVRRQVFVLMDAVNDVFHCRVNQTDQHLYINSIAHVADTLSASGATVILASPTPADCFMYDATLSYGHICCNDVAHNTSPTYWNSTTNSCAVVNGVQTVRLTCAETLARQAAATTALQNYAANHSPPLPFMDQYNGLLNDPGVQAILPGVHNTFKAMAHETMQVAFDCCSDTTKCHGPACTWTTVTFGTESSVAAAISTIDAQLGPGHTILDNGRVDLASLMIGRMPDGTLSRVLTQNVAAGITTKLGIPNPGGLTTYPAIANGVNLGVAGGWTTVDGVHPVLQGGQRQAVIWGYYFLGVNIVFVALFPPDPYANQYQSIKLEEWYRYRAVGSLSTLYEHANTNGFWFWFRDPWGAPITQAQTEQSIGPGLLMVRQEMKQRIIEPLAQQADKERCSTP